MRSVGSALLALACLAAAANAQVTTPPHGGTGPFHYILPWPTCGPCAGFDGTIDSGVATDSGDTIIGWNPFVDPTTGAESWVPADATITIANNPVFSRGDLRVYNGSTLDMTGGTIRGFVQAFDTAQIRISGGSLGFAWGHDQSVVTVTGGTFTGVVGDGKSTMTVTDTSPFFSVTARDESRVTVSGGEIRNAADVREDASLSISGAVIGAVNARGRGTVSVDGGRIRGDASAFDASHLTLANLGVAANVIASGSESRLTLNDVNIGGTLQLADGSVVGFTNGLIGKDANSFGTSTVRLDQVDIAGEVNASDRSHVDVIGGAVLGRVRGFEGSTITLDGAILGASASTEGTLGLKTGTIGGSLSAGGHGTIAMDGGRVDEGVFADTFATVALNGGTIGSADTDAVTVSDLATLTLSGATVEQRVVVFGDASSTMLAGQAKAFVSAGTSDATILGGSILGDLTALEEAAVNLLGGSVGGNAATQGSGNLLVGGGNVAGAVGPVEGGTVVMTAGEAGSIQATGSGRLTASGGTVRGDATFSGTSETELGGVSVNGSVSMREKSRVDLRSGSIGGQVQSSDDSALSVLGGDVAGTVVASGGSTVIVTGGQIPRLEALGTSFVTLSGNGHVAGNARASDDANFIVNGNARIDESFGASGSARVLIGGQAVIGDSLATTGNADVLVQGGVINGGGILRTTSVGGHSTVRMTGGRISKPAQAIESGRFLMFGGVGDGLAGFNSSTISVSGGRLLGNISGDDRADITLGGGTVDRDFLGFGSSILHLNGGSVLGRCIVSESSELIVHGGRCAGGINPAAPSASNRAFAAGAAQAASSLSAFAYDQATIRLIGTDLVSTLFDPNFDDLFSAYQVSGFLADGTAIESGFLYVQNGTGARFELVAVPEPGTLTLLGFAITAGSLVRRRDRARRPVMPLGRTDQRASPGRRRSTCANTAARNFSSVMPNFRPKSCFTSSER